MKKIFIITLLIAFAGSVSVAQELNDKQYALVTKRTADWCPYCGSWGWEFFNDVLNDNRNKNAIIWAAHYSGGLANETSQDIAANFGGSGQPIFYFESDNLNVNSGNHEAKVSELNTLIDVTTSFEAFYRVGSSVEVTGDGVDVRQRVRFEVDKEAGADLYLATYLMQKRKMAPQTGQQGLAEHKNLIIASLNGGSFGQQLSKTAYSAGEEETFSTTISLDMWDYEPFDYNIVTILWAYENGKYSFLSGNVQDIDIQSSVEDIDHLKFTTFTSGNTLYIDLQDSDLKAGGVARIYDINGRVLTVDNLTEHERNQVDISTLTNGSYILEITRQGARGTAKFIKR